MIEISKQKVLELLKHSQGKAISGEEIANKLKLTRAAVWKNIDQLRKLGYDISAKTNEGYTLNGGGGYHQPEIQSELSNNYIGRKLIFVDKVDSSNNYAKNLAIDGAEEGTIVIASCQTGGKGRMKRSFYSPADKGIYLSAILRPKLAYQDMNLFTLCIAISVSDAIYNLCNLRPQIKWPNDILFGEKKTGGILSECMLEAETGSIDYLVCGIGINVNNDIFPEDINATSLFLESGKEIDRISLIKELCNQIENWYRDNKLLKTADEIVQQYKEYLTMLNEKVTFVQNNKPKQGIASDIDSHGGLVIIYPNGTTDTLYSGEIKLRRQQ